MKRFLKVGHSVGPVTPPATRLASPPATLLVTLLAALLATSACHGHSDATAATDAEPEAVPSAAVDMADAASDAVASASAAASAAPPVPPMRVRGLAGMFLKAAQGIDLTDDEKAAIAKIEEPLQTDAASHHEMSALHADLVASVKAGKMETAKIATDEAAVAKVLAAREEEQAAALGALHDALTPAQRGAIVDAVRTAHDRPIPAPPAPGAGSPDWAARRLERMKAQLVLDDDQQRDVGAVLARVAVTPAASQAHAEAMKKQLEAVLVAFEKDTFDAKKLDLSAVPGKKATDPIDRQIKYIGQLLPILTAGQRDRFAGMMDHTRERHGDSITEAPEPGGLGGGPGR